MAHTVPEEDRENYVTEEEAVHMIKGFNTHLKNFSIQVEELGKQNLSLLNKFDKARDRNDNFRALISSAKSNFNELDDEIESKSNTLSNLEAKIDSEAFKIDKDINLSEITSKIVSNIDQEETQMHLQTLLDYLANLETTSIILQTREELLNKRIIEKQESLNSEIRCVNCRERYVPVNNCQTACVYHTGKLKYFSCRGCGRDAYYDCCMKCKECSRGCKVTHHTS